MTGVQALRSEGLQITPTGRVQHYVITQKGEASRPADEFGAFNESAPRLAFGLCMANVLKFDTTLLQRARPT